MSDRSPEAKAESKIEGALARVLEAMSQAEHPLRHLSVWRYSDSVGGGFGWTVSEVPVPIQHGTPPIGKSPATDWLGLATKLLEDLDKIREKDSRALEDDEA